MSLTFNTIARCELCEHRDDIACVALASEVAKTVATLRGRMARHGHKLPDAEVIIDCHSFFRLGRRSGK